MPNEKGKWKETRGEPRTKNEEPFTARPKTPRAIDIHRARYSIRLEEAERGRKL